MPISRNPPPSTIRPISNYAYWPLDLSAICPAFATSKPFRLVVQGLANAPVVGPVLKEKLSMLPGMKANRVNETIKMECPKVVDTIDIEDMGDKGVFCRYFV